MITVFFLFAHVYDYDTLERNAEFKIFGKFLIAVKNHAHVTLALFEK